MIDGVNKSIHIILVENFSHLELKYFNCLKNVQPTESLELKQGHGLHDSITN